ncbi:MAG TPA: RNB domain-containing ribonuclease, partial [Terriglobia bacterium]|nr:RNB domain-containing ribonuclease [Terriglobia bacterium]
RRRDFRALAIVTIDGETAKDFDDAVHVERLLDGKYVLQVHIADVAHFVRPGTALDREARLRGTSVYFPDRAVPMLPLELSNGICSLNPHVDRLTMSVLMELDPAGQVVAYEITPGIIRSAERMTYTAVYAALSGESDPAGRDYGAQVEHFRRMEELARLLSRRRDVRGSIDFDLPEPEIEFDPYGRMIGVTRSERNIAHRIIEEFMLAANETVARHLEQAGVPTLYRVHEKPDPKKVLEFEEIAATFGYSLGIELPAARRVRVRRDPRGRDDRYPRFEDTLLSGELEITSRHYQRLTRRIAGKPEERILSYLMLRSLKQARYSEENLGHFALASKTYTHFTSPIRRYPDLIVHRILKAVLDQEGASVRSSPGGAAVHPQELLALGLETSEAERRAADAEREVMEWKKVSFMAGRLGDEFEALIIGLTKHGLFVELTDLFIEGFVPLSSFEDDRYVYREKLRAIVADASQRAYRLGDRVRVRLDRIERAGNKLEFAVTS